MSTPALRRRRIRSMALVTAAVLLGVLVIAALIRTSDDGVSYGGELRAGGTLTSLTLPRLEGDGVLEYASVDDRPLVINFFASWCPSCIAEMPDFERVQLALGDRIEMWGVSQNDAPSASVELARSTGITYPTAIDRDGAFFNALGVTGMPTTVFVLPGGRIADVWQGALDEASLLSLISERLGVS